MKDNLRMNSLNIRLRERDESATKQHIEAKQRRVKEIKGEVSYLEKRLSVAKDRLMIKERELKEIKWRSG